MASPQLENGYTRIANELLENLCKEIGGKVQLRIVLYVLRFTYGFNKKMMPLNTSQISRTLDIDRPNCIRTIRKLVENNILLKEKYNGVYSIGINKDYEQWGRKRHSVNLTHVLKTTKRVCHGDTPLKKDIKKYKNKPPIGPPKPKNKTAVPAEYPINSNILIWIQGTLGEIPMEFIERERDKFLDRHESLGNKFSSWDAAFRTWMRNWFFKFGGKDEVEGGTKPTLDQAVQASWERRHGKSE